MSTADIREQFGERIRALRQARGWTQVEMADFLAMDRSYLSEIETGKKDPSLTMLKTLATGLKITISKLTDGL
ncbi:helix-turn-helix domain-containing protein [Telmatobacter bradus]|uniref:helix-turn-helix domain-containing protein n=1 Tax=Telmatobacter bradus TaxID=474953 RepID=UPI003B432B12